MLLLLLFHGVVVVVVVQRCGDRWMLFFLFEPTPILRQLRYHHLVHPRRMLLQRLGLLVQDERQVIVAFGLELKQPGLVSGAYLLEFVVDELVVQGLGDLLLKEGDSGEIQKATDLVAELVATGFGLPAEETRGGDQECREETAGEGMPAEGRKDRER